MNVATKHNYPQGKPVVFVNPACLVLRIGSDFKLHLKFDYFA